MKWYINKNLSDSDIELLAKTDTVERMMRSRVTVDFDSSDAPSFDDLGLDNTRDLYYIKVSGKDIIQFWFLDALDLVDFEEVLTELKLKVPVK